MNLKEIVKNYLEKNGYGGIFNSDAGCGCDLDDLIPCGEPSMDCEAGYKIKCTEKCEHDCADGSEWHIQGDKP